VGAVLWRLLDRDHNNELNFAKYTLLDSGCGTVARSTGWKFPKQIGGTSSTGTSTPIRRPYADMIL
jgi:hypothetical protein